MYSFDFAAQVTRLCMNEICRRGLEERKILRKSAPNSVLLLKVFHQQNCTADDLVPVSIHSVATLMQDTLWCCQDRIVPKKVWRVINYETCTLPNLSRFISRKGEELLIEILDFLVEVMRHKSMNLMDAYHLGEAMGKVTLGPADCDPIIAEKAGHFMTRMIIEHSKRDSVKRVDSGFSPYLYYEYRPMSKSEAAKAKAKSYDRVIRKIRRLNTDWASNIAGLREMLEDDYEPEPLRAEEPWISIFSHTLNASDAEASPLLYRIVAAACQPKSPIPTDPFASSSLFHDTKPDVTQAFSEFAPLCVPAYEIVLEKDGKGHRSHLRKINNSLSHMKLNLRKPKVQGLESDLSNEDTLREEEYTIHEEFVDSQKSPKHKQVKSMMRKVYKLVPKKNATGPTVY